MEYNKITDIKLQISNYLQDILNYSKGAYEYIVKPETIYDVDELIYAIKAIPECVETIEELINELEQEYENEQL